MKAITEHSNHWNTLENDNTPAQSETLRARLRMWQHSLGFYSILAAVPIVLAGNAQDASAAEVKKTPNAVDDTVEKRAAQRVRRPLKPDFLRRQDSYRLPHQQNTFDLLSPMSGTDDCPGAQVPSGAYTAAAPFIDTGDTTGANNTINTVYCYFCFYLTLGSNGPDHVYTFTLTSTGANPEIRVTPNSGSYNPLIYILAENRSAPCPATPATGTVDVFSVSTERGAGGPQTFGASTVRFLPLNVPLHLFIDSVSSTANPAGAYTLRMQDVSIAEGRRTKFDFDRDGDSDISVFRPSDGTWYTERGPAGSPQQFSSVQFGLSTDRIVPADYDGDGKTDFAVFRDGIWYWINSSDSGVSGLQFGSSGDIPQPADFDGDGRSEIAVFRAGTWYTYNLRTGEVVVQPFGISGDKPVVGDYDGDGRADYAVYRNGTWFMQRSFRGFLAIPFGLPNDIPVPANYSFDRNQAGPAVFRDGTWHILSVFSDNPRDMHPFQFRFGQPGDIPVPGDYNGDGAAEPAVFRNGIWYVGGDGGRLSATHPFGLAGDRPVPAAYLQR